MAHTREEVLNAIKNTFKTENFNEILSQLDLYGEKDYEHERDRVQLAIIKLSQGDKDKLLYLINVAKTDYRDVLAWEQLGPLSEIEGEKLQTQARELIDKLNKK